MTPHDQQRFAALVSEFIDGCGVGGACLGRDHVDEATQQLLLAADVAGSCRLIGIDEEGTLEGGKRLEETIFDPKIAQASADVVSRLPGTAL